MLPNPVEVAHDQSGRYLRLFPHLAKLVLSSMPSSSLLPNNAIGALQSLRLVLADVVEDFGGQDSLVASPIIAIPLLTVRFPLTANDQIFNQLIGVFSHSCS